MAKAAKKAATKTAVKAAAKAPKKAAAKAAAPAPKKAAAGKAAGKKAAGKNGGGKANPAFMAPLGVSPALGEVVGNKPLPRTEIIKKIWDYIKGNKLQDQENKRMINTDDKLGVIFDGKKQISMFEIAKGVNNHVSKQ